MAEDAVTEEVAPPVDFWLLSNDEQAALFREVHSVLDDPVIGHPASMYLRVLVECQDNEPGTLTWALIVMLNDAEDSLKSRVVQELQRVGAIAYVDSRQTPTELGKEALRIHYRYLGREF